MRTSEAGTVEELDRRYVYPFTQLDRYPSAPVIALRTVDEVAAGLA